jgi:hypothetical protein
MSVTVQFTNKQTGKNVDLQVPTDGKDHQVSKLVHTAGSDLAFVTEVQLVSNFENVTAVLKENGKQVGNPLLGNGDNVEDIGKVSVSDLFINATKAA